MGSSVSMILQPVSRGSETKSRSISGGAHMLFMAKNLERIGDHCTNIAEFVYFQITGEHLVQQERPKL
ncbi:MAG: hypothetical protein Kow0073_10990 [Immundisolibacter sp.]